MYIEVCAWDFLLKEWLLKTDASLGKAKIGMVIYSSVVACDLYDVSGRVVDKHLVQNYICIYFFLAAFWEYNSLGAP